MKDDFVTRLERELTQAAERDQRARARRPVRVRVPRLRGLAPALVAATMLVVVGVVIVSSPRDPETESAAPSAGLAPVPVAAQGTYTRSGDAALVLDPDGYTVESSSLRSTGSAATVQGVLVVDSSGKDECGGSGPGRYSLRSRANRLELSVIADDCDARRELLAGRWSGG